MASLTNIDAPGAYPATPLNEEPTSQTQHSNLQHQEEISQATPRSLENDLHSSREKESDKPGFMTGAYSRVGTQPSGSTQNANYTYGDIASQSPYGEDTTILPKTATKLAAETPVEPVNTPAENTAINSINKTSPHSHGGDHNKIQSGLRGSAHTAHEEPYWGDIPFGTGVYNGVTGHGSNETTAEGSVHDHQHDTATNTGIYNSVTGHGSKRSTSPGSSKYDEGTTAADSAHQQRAFPLANNGSTTTTTTKLDDFSEPKRDSRFKEGFAGAGAAAAGGYAAHEYFNKDNDGSARATDEKLSGHQEKTLDRQPLDTENVNKHQKKEDADFAKLGAVAAVAGAGAYGADKYAHRDSTKELSSKPENTLSQSTAREPTRSNVDPLYAENEIKHNKKEDSNLGKHGAAAAAAGAGAYTANKYANRDSAKEASPVSENNTSKSAAREPLQNDAQVVGDNSRTQYNKLSDGTPSGIALDNAHQSERQNVTSDGTSTMETQSTGRASSDSSHGGLYNVLSSGTPSGINLEHMHEQKQQPTSKFLSNAPPAPSSRTIAASERDPAAALGNSPQVPATQELPEQLPSAGNATGSAFTSGHKMTHTCTKCGQEDDISHYMRI